MLDRCWPATTRPTESAASVSLLVLIMGSAHRPARLMRLLWPRLPAPRIGPGRGRPAWLVTGVGEVPGGWTKLVRGHLISGDRTRGRQRDARSRGAEYATECRRTGIPAARVDARRSIAITTTSSTNSTWPHRRTDADRCLAYPSDHRLALGAPAAGVRSGPDSRLTTAEANGLVQPWNNVTRAGRPSAMAAERGFRGPRLATREVMAQYFDSQGHWSDWVDAAHTALVATRRLPGHDRRGVGASGARRARSRLGDLPAARTISSPHWICSRPSATRPRRRWSTAALRAAGPPRPSPGGPGARPAGLRPARAHRLRPGPGPGAQQRSHVSTCDWARTSWPRSLAVRPSNCTRGRRTSSARAASLGHARLHSTAAGGLRHGGGQPCPGTVVAGALGATSATARRRWSPGQRAPRRRNVTTRPARPGTGVVDARGAGAPRRRHVRAQLKGLDASA
jgi:hypothetical protein